MGSCNAFPELLVNGYNLKFYLEVVYSPSNGTGNHVSGSASSLNIRGNHIAKFCFFKLHGNGNGQSEIADFN